MNNLEEQLNKLPQAKLSKKIDLYLRFNFWKLSWQNYFKDLSSFFIIKRLASVAMVVILLSFLVGLPYYAYASSDIVRGNILYPLKQGVENIELGLANTPEKKITVLTKLASRRLTEVNKLSQQASAQTDSNLAQTINQMVSLTTQADEDASSTSKTEQKTSTKNKIESIKQQQLASVENIAKKRGLKASDQLLDSVALAIDNLKQEREIQHFSDNSQVTPETASTTFYQFFGHDRMNIASTSVKTSTSTEKKTDGNIIKFNQEISTKSLENIRERVNILKNSLSQEGAAPDDTNNLLQRLDNRLNKAQSAIDSGNFNQAQGLIKSTDAISNNAKHFLRFTERPSSTPENLTQEGNKNISNEIKKGQPSKRK
jgi:hypothetical protein